MNIELARNPRWTGLLVASLAATLMSACGGGDPLTDADADAADRRKALSALVPTTEIPPDANTSGMWSPVTSWPLIAIHAVVLPDGRLLTYGTNAVGKQTGYFDYDVWDPAGGLDGGHLTLPNETQTDLFCSASLVLPQGDAVVLTGGDNWTGSGTTNTGNDNSNIFSPGNNTLTRGNNMNRARWYASAITLLNGESYIQGGTGGTDLPEVRKADGTFRLLTSADTSFAHYNYPRNYIAPDGRVFGFDAAGKMYYVDPTGTGQITRYGQFGSTYSGSDSSSAMFRPGRILQFGGESNNAIVIDITNGPPVVSVSQPMSSQRRWVNATILANGKVLATGGSSVRNELVDVNTSAEIWDPDTGTWSVGARGVQARLYHSTAVLLPDATVLVLGGGAPGPEKNLNVELYFPPYLFTAGGNLASRLSIDAAPGALNIGGTFPITVSGGSAARVVMVKTSAVTHSFNAEQRFVELAFSGSGGQLSVQAPTRAADAPPGFYMLFALDANGVPSVAKMVRVNIAGAPNQNVTPTLTSVGDQSSAVGSNVSLQLQATDPNGDVLGYAAVGLPPGLTVNSTSGKISGQPQEAGTFNVVAAVSDGVNSATTSFIWNVTGGGLFVLSVGPPPPPTKMNDKVSFTASAQGTGVRFKWNFGDGSPETAYSSSPSASHTYTKPGIYTVLVTAVDSQDVELHQTLTVAVYLPPLAGQPVTSGNVVVQKPSSGNPRIWVVNQDNNSVSVLDAVTGKRLAEIAVGAAPRTLAIAPGSKIWVANKGSGTLSVIDASKLKVIKTITLARGSQPFGIVVAASKKAYVALEAGGKLLKFDTGNYAQKGSVDVGPQVRHVSLNADGTKAYVTRFITRPVPGESTATPQSASGSAELLVVDTASMTVNRTITLAHSDKEDGEVQGRGIPNYLGAAVLSPDGKAAWVPSKQDNVARGTLRDGQPLDFQNTVRAISSRIDLAGNAEDLAARVDHDNASVASAALFDPKGVYLFVALETSREVAVVDAHGKHELFRFDATLAPQGLALTPDGKALVVNNFMSRTVQVFDLKPLLQLGQFNVPLTATFATVGNDKLAPEVLRGKQLFYDARDLRLARDGYLSCASCHNDGGHDGRVWDLTGFGEGLRNTVALRGRGGMGHGGLHWSNNFDEVQDFEGQIRALAGGTGLMSDDSFAQGTRSQPLGDAKAGLSADLDALAAYVDSLKTFDPSPKRPSGSTLSSAATAGKALFVSMNCGSCHGGAAFTLSGSGTLSNVGTIKPASGKRLGGPLTGIDVPTLRDVWATAPYLHDGSAATVGLAIRAHSGVSIGDTDLANLSAYLLEIGSDESTAPTPEGQGGGLTGNYFNKKDLSGASVLTRVEAIDFDWQYESPHPSINVDNFSARWTGRILASTTGDYRFETVSDDGIRVWVSNQLLIDNWTGHSATTDTSAPMRLEAGQSYPIKVEYFDSQKKAVLRLRWKLPGSSSAIVIPEGNLLPQ
jgi:YVTN family beta-propeller protein